MDSQADTMRSQYNKAVLMSEMESAWTQLNDALDRLTPEQMTAIKDPEGWAVKDHLAHIAAWERSVIVFLQGRPRHEGLGVNRQLYEEGGDDKINAAVQEREKDVPLSEALGNFRETHRQLVSLVEPMSDDDLYKPNSDFQPDAQGERDERPVLGMIYSNTANHFREHQEWIESLVSQGS